MGERSPAGLSFRPATDTDAESFPHLDEALIPPGPSEPVRVRISTDEFCMALTDAARSSHISVSFFARLIWQESRFRFDEISDAGAQGIAQFMPKTAAEIGLDDPFDPSKVLPASARFLRKLHDRFGNLGLAAAAYNAGSGRIQNWLARREGLPAETRDYVLKITGNSAESWTEEARTVAFPLELPSQAPCEGIAGLSRTKDRTAVSVALSPSVSNVLHVAAQEAILAAKAEAAARAKSRIALLQSRKRITVLVRRPVILAADASKAGVEQHGRLRLASASAH